MGAEEPVPLTNVPNAAVLSTGNVMLVRATTPPTEANPTTIISIAKRAVSGTAFEGGPDFEFRPLENGTVLLTPGGDRSFHEQTRAGGGSLRFGLPQFYQGWLRIIQGQDDITIDVLPNAISLSKTTPEDRDVVTFTFRQKQAERTRRHRASDG